MIQQATIVNQVWVIDAMCLSHFARAERLDILRDLLVDKECWTTRVVLEEVKQGVGAYSALNHVWQQLNETRIPEPAFISRQILSRSR